MQSSIMSTLGLGGIDPGIWVIVLCVCIIAIIILIALNSKNKKQIAALSERVDALTSGEDGKSLEEELDQIIKSFSKIHPKIPTISERSSEDSRVYIRRWVS